MLHEVFQDRKPYKFQDEPVDDKVVRGSINETIVASTKVGNFSWGLTSTSTSSEDATYAAIGPRMYFRMSNKGKDDMDFARVLITLQMDYSRKWRK